MLKSDYTNRYEVTVKTKQTKQEILEHIAKENRVENDEGNEPKTILNFYGFCVKEVL